MLATAGTDQENVHGACPAKALREARQLGRSAAPSSCIIVPPKPNKATGDRGRAASAPARQAAANVAEFTVSELSSAIKRTLEGAFGYVRLRGEISGFRGAHASGHCYFALKDDKARSRP